MAHHLGLYHLPISVLRYKSKQVSFFIGIFYWGMKYFKLISSQQLVFVVSSQSVELQCTQPIPCVIVSFSRNLSQMSWAVLRGFFILSLTFWNFFKNITWAYIIQQQNPCKQWNKSKSMVEYLLTSYTRLSPWPCSFESSLFLRTSERLFLDSIVLLSVLYYEAIIRLALKGFSLSEKWNYEKVLSNLEGHFFEVKTIFRGGG